jgi:hypothetical protein
VKSHTQDAITRYAESLSACHAAICRTLRKEIDAALPKAASKIWHGSPVWFIGENPVVGYHATPKYANLLFWSGQLFGDAALKPLGKFKAAQIQFTDASQIDLKTLRRWLEKAASDIWDYQSHFKTQIARRKKRKA